VCPEFEANGRYRINPLVTIVVKIINGFRVKSMGATGIQYNQFFEYRAFCSGVCIIDYVIGTSMTGGKNYD
jgi:hypothetical protein